MLSSSECGKALITVGTVCAEHLDDLPREPHNNPSVDIRPRYDFLYHTDPSGDSGNTVIGLPIDRINWGNYNLVVIDRKNDNRRLKDEGERKKTRQIHGRVG